MTDATGAEGATEGQELVEPVEGVGTPQDPPAEPPGGDDEPKGLDEIGRLRWEAGKRRDAQRVLEAQVADNESHIAELQEYVIAGLISDRVADPKVFGKLVARDAWAGDDGRIDLAKLDEAVQQLLVDHPSLKPAGKPRPRTAPQPGKGVPINTGAPARGSALDKAFPQSGTTMRDLLERRPEAGSIGDTIRERSKTRLIKGRIGGEDD